MDSSTKLTVSSKSPICVARVKSHYYVSMSSVALYGLSANVDSPDELDARYQWRAVYDLVQTTATLSKTSRAGIVFRVVMGVSECIHITVPAVGPKPNSNESNAFIYGACTGLPSDLPDHHYSIGSTAPISPRRGTRQLTSRN